MQLLRLSIAALATAFATFASQAADGLSPATLVKSFLIPQGTNPPQASWMAGDASIRWSTPKPVQTPKRTVHPEHPLQRIGTVQVVGFADPSWQVTVSGVQQAPIEVFLDNHSRKPGENESDFADTLKRAGFKMKQLCNSGGAAGSWSVYATQAPGTYPVVMKIEQDPGGSAGGPSVSVALGYTKEVASSYKCP